MLCRMNFHMSLELAAVALIVAMNMYVVNEDLLNYEQFRSTASDIC